MWEEGLRVALRCMTEEPFTGHRGQFVSMPPRNVVPKPSQKPHPPVWVACTRRETIHLAAQYGIGALSFAFFDPEEARHWVDDYYATLASRMRPDRRRGQREPRVRHRASCVTPTQREAVAPRRGGIRTSSDTRSATTTCSAGTARAHTDLWVGVPWSAGPSTASTPTR